MKLAAVIFTVSIFWIFVFTLYAYLTQKDLLHSPLPKKLSDLVEKPLLKYSFANLKKTSFPQGKIKLGKELEKTDEYYSQLFYFNDGPRKVSGQINVPLKEGEYPVIIMFRGFVPKEQYETGVGTRRAAQVFAKNGFITLAPDFLGYGKSDSPSTSSIEERFQTYTTVLSLLSSLPLLNDALAKSFAKWDGSHIGIWGHSNGGHIALSVLAITEKNYPTVLWAPVTKPFPYSILYYTDEFEDKGKALRRVVAEFEKDYDVENYTFTNYLSSISSPILLFQGGADDAVPAVWSDSFVSQMEKIEKDIDYVFYEGADHNLMPNGWGDAVWQSILFYQKHFK